MTDYPGSPSGNTAAACARERGPRDCAGEAGADSVTESHCGSRCICLPSPFLSISLALSISLPPLFFVVTGNLTLGNWGSDYTGFSDYKQL